MRNLWRRAKALFRRDVIADEISEEMRFHLDMRAEELRRRGWSEAESIRLARHWFGNVTRLRDEGYDVRGGGVLETVWQDVRYGIRRLGRRPTFAVAAVGTLSLGMALVAVLLSIVDAAWLRPLASGNPDRVMSVMLQFDATGGRAREFSLSPSVVDLEALRSATAAVAAVGSYHAFEERLVLDDGEPERVRTLSATAGYFEAMDAVPVLGRTFTQDDGRAGAEDVVILGFGMWRQRFGGAADVIGTRVSLEGHPATVIGVAPHDFHHSTQLWRPVPTHDDRAARRGSGARVIARLHPGVTVTDASRILDQSLENMHRDAFGVPTQVVFEPVYDDVVGDTRDAVQLIGLAVLVLVALVGVNVAGLVYAEGATRRQELAVRASLGAGRGRLIRQLLTDAALLAIGAAVLGMCVSAVSLNGLLAILPLELPPHVIPEIDIRVMSATMVVGVVTAWLVAALPAWRLTRMQLREWIDGRIPDSRSGRFGRPGQLVVAVQVTLAVILLAGGGLLVRTLDQLLSVDLGLDPDAVHVLEVTPLDPAGSVWETYYPALVDRLRAIPGIEAVGASDWIPFAPTMLVMALDPDEDGPDLTPAGVTPGLLEALGVTVLNGRAFSQTDVGQPVVVLSESAAREVFNDTDVVGRVIDWPVPHSVIGVVSDVRGWGPESKPQNIAYMGLVPHALTPPAIVFRAGASRPSLPELRSLASSIGPRAIVERVRPLSALLDDNIRAPRQRTALLMLLAGLGLVLALVGVGGVTAQSVVRRTRELGLRLSFGATSGQVVRLVARDTILPSLAGLAVGLVIAYFGGRLLEEYLFQVSPTDRWTMAAVGIVVVVVTTVVAWVPARRASRVDPVEALRE
jgi:predicted permease